MAIRGLQVLGLACLLAGAGLTGFEPAAAQPEPPGPAARNYNPQTVETVEGTVMSVERTAPSRHGGAGVHLTLRTAQGPLAVHLGPTWFIDGQPLRVAAGDRITVTGSRIDMAGKPALIARSLTKGGETLTLRDEAGRPVWAGQRPRTP
ncbi:MAG: DNA-binding protein [Candidatus Sericytochromatia bacterium]